MKSLFAFVAFGVLVLPACSSSTDGEGQGTPSRVTGGAESTEPAIRAAEGLYRVTSVREGSCDALSPTTDPDFTGYFSFTSYDNQLERHPCTSNTLASCDPNVGLEPRLEVVTAKGLEDVVGSASSSTVDGVLQCSFVLVVWSYAQTGNLVTMTRDVLVSPQLTGRTSCTVEDAKAYDRSQTTCRERLQIVAERS
jgi:hypothetical protein